MFKAIDKWFFGYLMSVLRRPRGSGGLRHLMVCLCDHYEPYRDGATREDARRCVREWTEAYPQSVSGFRDADGYPPRHTFFYPEEEYDEEILDRLAEFCGRGFGEVEIHLHHRHDTAEGLREKLVRFRDLLHQRHGLLGVERLQTTDLRPQTTDHKEENSVEQKSQRAPREENCISARGGRENFSFANFATSVNNSSFSRVRYGFIHGNWALCNSRPDGDWCGVNEELGVLAGTGCYADFTFPSLPSGTQTRMVNAIYYAKDTPGKPRGADRGIRVKATRESEQKSQRSLRREPVLPAEGRKKRAFLASFAASVQTPLLLITGPVGLNWFRRKWGVLPRIESAEISGSNPPTADRVRLWVKQRIGVQGRPDWVFVKLHTHGCVPGNAKVLLGNAMRTMHETLQREFNDGKRWQLHYVTAREMYNVVKAAEAGKAGAPGPWRDWLVSRPGSVKTDRGNAERGI